jgi:site-specific DNA recombinase
MFAWYAQEGRRPFGLAQKLRRDDVAPPLVRGRWNVTTLRQMLTNPVYTGQVYAGRIQSAPLSVRPREDWIEVAAVPAIITGELFDRVQDKLAQNKGSVRGGGGNSGFGRGVGLGWPSDLAARVELRRFHL